MKFYDLLLHDEQFAEALGYSELSTKINIIKPNKPEEIKPKPEGINIVIGGSEKINQAAVRKKGAHILLDPVNSEFGKFDSATARVAKDNNVTIGISHIKFQRNKGSQLVKLIKNWQRAIKITNKMKNSIVIVSGAESNMEMRAPMGLSAIGSFIGLSENQAKWSVSKTPEGIMEAVK